jgi:mannitol-1-phosphate/altronate dehydrogenase
MKNTANQPIFATTYDLSACEVGVVHVGFGAFHRAHQAVYLDDYMNASGDLRWGIAAVNLRAADAQSFDAAKQDIERHNGYFLKSYSADGAVEIRRVRPHIRFSDWSVEKAETEALLASASVQLVTMTVSESGYYAMPDGSLNASDPAIQAEAAGEVPQSIYGYLRAGLALRAAGSNAPITIACCDNIRQNGKKLRRNFLAYLDVCGDTSLAEWVKQNAAFPCSMVDRITPRSPASLADEMTELLGQPVASPIMAEDYIQWVLEDQAAAEMPDLGQAGVTVTPKVDPYEETKIRVLNGGHTALTYLAALEGIETFDAAMRLPHLYAHFQKFEMEEVLPAIDIALPFSKEDYVKKVEKRFSNQAIGDTVARICADGMAKFPIFIRPTLEGCFAKGIVPIHAITSIASWYVFARHVAAGKIPFDYVEPSWDELSGLLGNDGFVTSQKLWADLPETYSEFAETLRNSIVEMEAKWPI